MQVLSSFPSHSSSQKSLLKPSMTHAVTTPILQRGRLRVRDDVTLDPRGRLRAWALPYRRGRQRFPGRCVWVTGLMSLDPAMVETRLDPKFKSTRKALVGGLGWNGGGTEEREALSG